MERCIDRRYQQVLDSHQLKDGQITEAIRISERNKATISATAAAAVRTGAAETQPARKSSEALFTQ